MRKISLLLSIFIYSSVSFSQILITGPDLDVANPLDCNISSGPDANFFDSGDSLANYSANENEILTICPDFAGGTSKLFLSFGINTGLLFDVDPSDTLYVYDGPNTSAPLLGKHNSSTDPTGFSHAASFINNPSGCLTVQFISDAANEGTGWDANIKCIQDIQPIEAHMQGFVNGSGVDIITPKDTGYLDVCFGDSILFVASSLFPYSSDTTGVGYPQNNTNINYLWETSNGITFSGDSLWFSPPSRNGFIVRLTTTDILLQEVVIQAKIRVSTIPSFSGVLNARDSVCFGDTTIIIGSVTTSNASGVDPTASGFQTGGAFSVTTFLPDDANGVYTTPITIGGYNPGSTITNASDIQMLSVVMEHSWLGDLEMVLTCPNGTQTTIFNSYDGSGDLVPGGFGGGSTYLGDALDDGTINPGIGWRYDWSTINATLGDFPTEYANGNTIATTLDPGSAMDTNGVYLPEQSFANFIGCPLNGNWIITIKDNQAIDNGYIFEWEILFDTIFSLNEETYVPSLVAGEWLTASTILPGNPTDTFIVVTSNVPGINDYTFQVTDDYGCVYDTTVQVYFLPGPSVQPDTVACAGQYQIVGTTAFSGGEWSFSGPGTATFFPNITTLNPSVNVDVNGSYTFTFTDNQCNLVNSFEVYFADSVDVTIVGGNICVGDELTIDATSQVLGATYLWNNGSTDPSIIVTEAGTYDVIVTGACNTATANATLSTEVCNVSASNVVTPNGDGMNDLLFFTGLDRFPTSKLEVFNRWGLLIYSESNYRNDWLPSDFADGTYFYVLTPEGSGGTPQEPLKGSFTLIK